MKASSIHTAVLRQIESALETSCASLVAVEALRARAGALAGDLVGIETQTSETIAALRRTTALLRAERDERASPLAFGFVLGSEEQLDAGVSPSRA